MAQQLLDDPQVRAALEQVGREEWRSVCGLTPSGRPARAGSRSSRHRRPRTPSGAPWWLRKTAVGAVDAGRVARRASTGPRLVEVRLERLARRPAEQPDALLAALAEHPQLAAAQVERAEVAAASSLIRSPAA